MGYTKGSKGGHSKGSSKGHKGSKHVEHVEQVSGAGYEQEGCVDFGDLSLVQSGQTIDIAGFGGCTQTALGSLGLVSGSGFFNVNIGGQCVDVHESELKASKKRSGRFSVVVNGKKHKLRLDQIKASSQECSILSLDQQICTGDSDVLRVRSACETRTPCVEYCQTTVTTRPSPITFYPYYKVKIGDTVKVLPYHIVTQGKTSRRFFRFKYDGKTITVRKSAIRPVRRDYRVMLDGRIMEVSASAIQHYGDNEYLVTHNGVERIVGAASVHSGVQDGAELITDDEAEGCHQSLFICNRPTSPGYDACSDRMFGLKKRYTKKRGGKKVRRQPRRKNKSKKDFKIFDVSFCLCYQIILNGAHIVIPQHRIKQSKRHTGYMRFRYNKMVYYITPQTITQAFYAPVVGYYSIVIDEKIIVVSGREMEKHPEIEDTYIIRHGGIISHVHSTNICFLGEYVLEPDREQLTDEGESTAVSSDDSCTSDSDASVSGRDEIVEDANVYTSRTFQIRRRCIAICYRIRVNGSEMVVPVSQVVPCKTRHGMLRVTYYSKTYFINHADIELQYETEVTGFYSVTINGNPVILTGDDIEDHPSEGTYVCFYKNSRYVLAQTQIMYLGEYPVIHAENYCETEFEYSDSSEGEEVDEVSEEEPQMCVFVNEKPNMDITLPEPTSGCVMGWKVYIDGRFYTVPANRLKQLRNAPGFMEIIVNRKLYHVSIENIQPIMLPTVYFITIQNKPILVPAKDVRRHPTQEGYVIVRYRGQDYVIAVGELKLADGTAVSIEDIALDQEYRVKKVGGKKVARRVKSFRACSPLCDRFDTPEDQQEVIYDMVNPFSQQETSVGQQSITMNLGGQQSMSPGRIGGQQVIASHGLNGSVNVANFGGQQSMNMGGQESIHMGGQQTVTVSGLQQESMGGQQTVSHSLGQQAMSLGQQSMTKDLPYNVNITSTIVKGGSKHSKVRQDSSSSSSSDEDEGQRKGGHSQRSLKR